MPTENRLPNGQQIPNLNPSDNNQLEFPTAILDANGNGTIPGNFQINGTLNTTGNTMLANTSGNTVKTFHNTLDDGNGNATIAGATTLGNTQINGTLNTGSTQINGSLNTTGNTTLANTSGNTVKTFHNTLDDGRGRIITSLSATALPSTYDPYNCFAISNLTAINGVTFSSTDPRIFQIGLGPKGTFIACINALDLTLNSVVLLPTHIAQFTTNGNWTVPTGVTTIYVSGCAGGAGGTAAVPGNAGQSCIKKAIAVTPGHVLAITIGAGGTGNANSNTTVNPGGPTTIVDSTTTTTLLSLSGGGSALSSPTGGLGIPGKSGPFGQGGVGAGDTAGVGGNATGYGSGGGRGYNATGGNGANGIIFLEW